MLVHTLSFKKMSYYQYFLFTTGILKKVTTYSSSDESGDEKLNEVAPPQEAQPALPEVKTENGHTEAHPNGRCGTNI